MLSSPWGTFLPVVLGTLHQSETSCTPSLRFVIPLQRPCQAYVTQLPNLQAKYFASPLRLRPAFSSQGFVSLPPLLPPVVAGFLRRVFAELFTNPPQRVPPPHTISHQPALGLFHGSRGRNDQLLPRLQPLPRFQVVGRRTRSRS